MATVIFYGKPGCASNAKQQQWLRDAGHTVVAKDLLSTVWQAEELLKFFDGLPVSQWFNVNAPAVKYGELDPGGLTADAALALLLAEPLLIRRPLLQVGEERRVGFDADTVAAWLGTTALATAPDGNCSKPPGTSGCGHG
jgi:nitrogenase-associated protein